MIGNGNGHANGHANGHDTNGHGFTFSWDDIEPPPQVADGTPPPWQHPREPLGEVDFLQLGEAEPEPRDWAVDQWFPMLETCGLAGPGGEGKTLLAQMLATSTALDKPWLELPVKPMKSALVLCEDRVPDAHRRQVAINRRYNCKLADLAGKMKIYARRNNQFNRLGIFDRDGELHITEFFSQLLEDLLKFAAKLVILDTRGDVFKGNQNDEDHARTFVRRVCDKIALELGGLVILLYQPSRAGIHDGSLQSGSVQWDAAFRARIGLDRPLPIDGEPPDRDLRLLTRLKSNYSASGESLEIRWKDGVFVRDEPEIVPAYEMAAERSKAERVFLRLATNFTAAGRPLSQNMGSPNYAPKIFSKEDAAEGCSLRQLEKAMGQLFDKGTIAVEKVGSASRNQSRIVLR